MSTHWATHSACLPLRARIYIGHHAIALKGPPHLEQRPDEPRLASSIRIKRLHKLDNLPPAVTTTTREVSPTPHHTHTHAHAPAPRFSPLPPLCIPLAQCHHSASLAHGGGGNEERRHHRPGLQPDTTGQNRGERHHNRFLLIWRSRDRCKTCCER